MEYIYVYREDDAAEIKEYRVGFIKKTAEELVELYNREARMGIIGVHRQALYLLAMKVEFEERFGLSPISFEDRVLGIGKEIEGWVVEVPEDQEDPIEFEFNGITYSDSEKLKLAFSGLIIRVDSINRYFGKLRTFLDSHCNFGVTNGKLLLMLEMNSPPHFLIEFSENVLIPLGLKEKEDFIFADEERVSSEKIERHSTTNQPNSGCINISWIGGIVKKDGDYIWFSEPFSPPEVCEANSEKRSNMTVNKLFIVPTANTPLVSFSPNGEMLIRGRSIPEDGSLFYEDLYDWVQAYKQNTAINTVFTIDLEYLNDISAKYLLRIIKFLHHESVDILVKWVYESDDTDMLELGQMMNSCSKCRFEFIEKPV